jgi:CHAT domain-containing protein
VEEELDRIFSRLEGWQVIRDLSPTVERIRSEAACAQLLHLAAHGSLRSDNPAYSFLQTAGGPIFVHDLVDLKLPQSTVVLSACSSGRGAAPVGEEWIGLARGFLQAGAASVVASLWPIHEGPTVELMDRFYEAHAAGDPTPAAMGKSMRRVLPRFPHPWAWAAFAVLGGLPFQSESDVE